MILSKPFKHGEESAAQSRTEICPKSPGGLEEEMEVGDGPADLAQCFAHHSRTLIRSA